MRLTDPPLWRSQSTSHQGLRSCSTFARDDAERRPLISTSSDEQSEDDGEQPDLTLDNHNTTQQNVPTTATDPNKGTGGDTTAHLDDKEVSITASLDGFTVCDHGSIM